MLVHQGGADIKSVVDMAKAEGGLVSAGRITAANLPRRLLTDAVNRGELRKVSRGLYALPDVWEDDYLLAQHRFARGIFSHATALFLSDMTDMTPAALTMTFPHGYNTTSVRGAGIIARTVSPELLGLGRTTVKTPLGSEVAAYDVERTLCDLVRGQATPDVQVVNPAMRAYARSHARDVNRLMSYADALGVAAKVRNYMEVLL